MDRREYEVYLRTLAGKPAAIRLEKERLGVSIQESVARARSLLTPETAPGLIWSLGIKEIQRVSELVHIQVSNFAGHARHLRAVVGSIPFTTAVPSEDPKTEKLLSECDELWKSLFYFEMLGGLQRNFAEEHFRKRRVMAGLMSLLSAVQGEMNYAHQSFSRVRKTFGPFSEVIEAAIGFSVEQAVLGIEEASKTVLSRLDAVGELTAPLGADGNSIMHSRRKEFQEMFSKE